MDFTPDNDEDTFYILANSEIYLEDMIDQIKEYFGTEDLGTLLISSEYIHARCITYDLYDSDDYDNYIVVRRK